MMQKTIIKNAFLINEKRIEKKDMLLQGAFIAKIADEIPSYKNANIIEASGKYLLPGVIDDQVHFREPGLTHKASIKTESRAALAGGITSFIEMPNTLPQTTTQAKLKEKFDIAAKDSYANYSFMFGGTNDNLKELLKTDPKTVAGIKLFLGSSTGNMLVDDETVLEKIFREVKLPISVHCEDEHTIAKNLTKQKAQYGENIPIKNHPKIRSEAACYLSSSKAIALAKKTGARLHVFHLSTHKETELFSNTLPLKDKKITAEVCIHHLCFSEEDYEKKGSMIKWNPAVKTTKDREELWLALLDDRIDVIATDHAPHTLSEKKQVYTKAPSGGPLVQHALLFMLDAYQKGKITLEKIVEKMCHNPATLFDIQKRGYLKEGYFADMVLVDLEQSHTVTKSNIYYKCGWSPFENTTFRAKILKTFVNGNLAYDEGIFDEKNRGMQLKFDR